MYNRGGVLNCSRTTGVIVKNGAQRNRCGRGEKTKGRRHSIQFITDYYSNLQSNLWDLSYRSRLASTSSHVHKTGSHCYQSLSQQGIPGSPRCISFLEKRPSSCFIRFAFSSVRERDKPELNKPWISSGWFSCSKTTRSRFAAQQNRNGCAYRVAASGTHQRWAALGRGTHASREDDSWSQTCSSKRTGSASRDPGRRNLSGWVSHLVVNT